MEAAVEVLVAQQPPHPSTLSPLHQAAVAVAVVPPLAHLFHLTLLILTLHKFPVLPVMVGVWMDTVSVEFRAACAVTQYLAATQDVQVVFFLRR